MTPSNASSPRPQRLLANVSTACSRSCSSPAGFFDCRTFCTSETVSYACHRSVHFTSVLPTTLVVHVEQSGRCVCLSACVRTFVGLLNILYLGCWFNLTLSRSSSRVKVIGQSSRSQDENVFKVVGVISSEGFLVLYYM